jgi:hypothetical protein
LVKLLNLKKLPLEESLLGKVLDKGLAQTLLVSI